MKQTFRALAVRQSKVKVNLIKTLRLFSFFGGGGAGGGSIVTNKYKAQVGRSKQRVHVSTAFFTLLDLALEFSSLF